MNQYTVELRIEAELLSPKQVTADLGLEPSLVRHAGDRRGGTSVFAKSLWAFSGRVALRDWPSLEDGLRGLLGELAPVRPVLQPYFQTCSVYWWCGSFQSEFGASATLSPELFKLLADFGAPLHLSSYFSEEP
jgi:Domain of unknown function (DUF4279)